MVNQLLSDGSSPDLVQSHYWPRERNPHGSMLIGFYCPPPNSEHK
jgi:hypothetical protein